MKELTQKQKEKEILILENASEIFAQKGYANTNIIDIAKKSNIGKGTIYNYFESKEDMFLKVIKYQLDKFLSTIMKSLNGINNIKVYLETYIEKSLDYYSQNSYSFDILLWSSKSLLDKAMETIQETQHAYLVKFKKQFSKDFEKISFISNPELIFLTIQSGIFAMMYEAKRRKNVKLADIKIMLKYLYVDGLFSSIENN